MAINTPTALRQARTAILTNANDLIGDAELLLTHDRAARAYGFAHLALEELAKLPMLLRCAVELAVGRSVDWKTLNRRLRSHKDKVDVIHALDYFNANIRPDDSDVLEYRRRLKGTAALVGTKNVCLYADEIGGEYRRPADVISPDLAERILSFVRARRDYLARSESITRDKLEDVVQREAAQMLFRMVNEVVPATDAMKDAAVEFWLHNNSSINGAS